MQDAKTEADGSTLKYVTEADDEVRMEQMSQAAQQFCIMIHGLSFVHLPAIWFSAIYDKTQGGRSRLSSRPTALE